MRMLFSLHVRYRRAAALTSPGHISNLAGQTNRQPTSDGM